MYLSFVQHEASPSLKKDFLSHSKQLGQVIESNKLHCSFFKPIVDETNGLDTAMQLYLVMVVSSNDYTLMKLAEQYNFPRGFPLIWVPGVSLQCFGFYPKFANDERQKSDEFKNVQSLHFFKKWSGFLGQCFCFTFNGVKYWTATSKNSASSESPFVQDAARLFSPFMTESLIDELINKQLHLCAEMMSFNDQVHGSRVYTETPIVTAIGKGSFLSTDSSVKDLVQFFSHFDLVNFCARYRLPCDSAVVINDDAEAFLNELSRQRDFMTDEKLESLRKSFFAVSLCGTVHHEDVLGDCLEGLVLKVFYKDGTSVIKKYKFPNYTIRTMLLREEFKNFSFSTALKDKALRFVQHWCVSEEGRKYWYEVALKAFVKFLSFQASPGVGAHIQISESLDDTIEDFDSVISKMTQHTVVLCLGPIGSGKSTIMNALCSLNENFVPIDGDILGLDKEKVSKTSVERGPLTRYRVIEALMNGKTPVLSTGGGALFSSDREQVFLLKKEIYQTLGILIRLIVLLPGDVPSLVSGYDLKVYDQTDKVKLAIKGRVQRGEWKLDPKFIVPQKTAPNAKGKGLVIGGTKPDTALDNFAKFIASKSLNNKVFAEKIIREADNVFSFPYMDEKTYGTNVELSLVMKEVVFNESVLMGTFNQVRLLTFVDNKVGHITASFGKTIMNHNDFSVLSAYYEPVVNGHIYTFASEHDEMISFAKPEKPYHDDGSTHITLDPGVHYPKDMRKAALAVLSTNSVVLTSKDGTEIKYVLKTKVPCKIEVCGAFALC